MRYKKHTCTLTTYRVLCSTSRYSKHRISWVQSQTYSNIYNTSRTLFFRFSCETTPCMKSNKPKRVRERRNNRHLEEVLYASRWQRWIAMRTANHTRNISIRERAEALSNPTSTGAQSIIRYQEWQTRRDILAFKRLTLKNEYSKTSL